MCVQNFSLVRSNHKRFIKMEMAVVFQLLDLKRVQHKKKDQIRVHKTCRKSHQVNQDIQGSPIIYIDLTWTSHRNSGAQDNWDNLDKPLQSYSAATWC